MKRNRVTALLGRVARWTQKPLQTMAVFTVLATGAGPIQAQDTNDWREEYAYALGVQAYIYYYPWLYMAKLRWEWVTQPPATPSTPSAPLNQFWHARVIMDPNSSEDARPNTDVLYSWAWLDLSQEPVILSVPPMNRYYTFELVSFDSDNFGYVGMRATGSEGGNYALLGPNWYGTLPDGVTALAPPNYLRSRTPYALIAGRTTVTNAADFATVTNLQSKYLLTPLSYWNTGKVPPVNTNVWAPYNTDIYPLGDWMTINRAATENIPNVPDQKALIDSFAEIGVGPGQDVTRMDAATQAGLIRAARDGYALIQDYFVTRGNLRMVNGWAFLPLDIGRAGQFNDFLIRASIQSWGGICYNDSDEAVYPSTNIDADGQLLSGTNSYTMTFAPGRLPDVGAFWSVTMYDAFGNVVSNRLDRYKLGSLSSPPLATNSDGSVTLYVQTTSPGTDVESNWLPAPADRFMLTLRCYMPGPTIVNQTWAPPPIQKVITPAFPGLRIETASGGVTVSWKDTAKLRFVVQCATERPGTRTIAWTTLPGEVTSADGIYRIAEACTGAFKYYRVLRLP